MKKTSIFWFVVGIFVWVSIIGFGISFLNTTQLPKLAQALISFIESAFATFAACYIGTRRYYVPASPRKLAYLTFGVSFFLSFVMFAGNLLMMGGIINIANMVGEPIITSGLIMTAITNIIISSIIMGFVTYATLNKFSKVSPE